MPSSTVLGVIAAGLAFFVSYNRLLFGLDIKPPSQALANHIKTRDDALDYYLEKHHKQIGDDYDAYRNHCLRVLTFTKYFLSLDKNIQLEPRVFNIIAMALAYHDIGLWTDNELNYLEPSVSQMSKRVLEEMQKSQQTNEETDGGVVYLPMRFHWTTFEEDSEVASTIILEHHKFTAYDHATAPHRSSLYKNNNNAKKSSQEEEQSPSQAAEEEGNETPKSNTTPQQVQHLNEIVNAVRKADWADATMGVVRFGLPQSLLAATYEAIPDAGFHSCLLNMGSRLSPNSLRGQLEVLKILKW